MKVWQDCGMGYEDMERKRYHGEITEEEFYEWYNYHCEMCPFMHTICMYGETLPDGSIYDEKFLEKTSREEYFALIAKYDEQQVEDTVDLTEWSDW